VTTASGAPIPAGEPGSASIARYERLRRHVLGDAIDADGAPGLALLMRRGLSACIGLADGPTPESPPPTRGVDQITIEDGLRGDIARVMVAMALGSTAHRRYLHDA
jgi:hypothetical protein